MLDCLRVLDLRKVQAVLQSNSTHAKFLTKCIYSELFINRLLSTSNRSICITQLLLLTSVQAIKYLTTEKSVVYCTRNLKSFSLICFLTFSYFHRNGDNLFIKVAILLWPLYSVLRHNSKLILLMPADFPLLCNILSWKNVIEKSLMN